MTEPLNPHRNPAQPSALREAAEAKRRETVDRLRAGIERLTARSPRPAITAKTIEVETGLAFKTDPAQRRSVWGSTVTTPMRSRHLVTRDVEATITLSNPLHRQERPRLASIAMIR